LAWFETNHWRWAMHQRLLLLLIDAREDWRRRRLEVIQSGWTCVIVERRSGGSCRSGNGGSSW
jgi:hypothetical protein